jgi:hypothetical protein
MKKNDASGMVTDVDEKRFDIAEELSSNFIIVSTFNPELWGYMSFEVYFHDPRKGMLYF